MGWHTKPNKRERGHALTEMALTLPILLLVVMGIMDFGRIFFLYSQVSNAAREGARWGAVNGVIAQGELQQFRDCDAIRAEVVSRFGLALEIEPEDIIIEYDDGATMLPFDCNGTVGPDPTLVVPGTRILVTVDAEFQFITPLVSSFMPSVEVSFTAARTILPGGTRSQPPIG